MVWVRTLPYYPPSSSLCPVPTVPKSVDVRLEAWFEESFVVPGEKFVQWRVLGFLKWEHSPSVGSRGTGRMGGRVSAAND